MEPGSDQGSSCVEQPEARLKRMREQGHFTLFSIARVSEGQILTLLDPRCECHPPLANSPATVVL